jgi:hypothetical protein
VWLPRGKPGEARTYTVEIDNGTRPVAKIKGFHTKEAADAWVAEEEQNNRAAGGTSARP